MGRRQELFGFWVHPTSKDGGQFVHLTDTPDKQNIQIWISESVRAIVPGHQVVEMMERGELILFV